MKKHPDYLHSFANLPPEVEYELRSLLKVRTFSSGETIFMQDEPPDALYLVASGRVKVIRVTQEGYESILCVRGPGDYFCPVPLLDKGNHLGSAVAMTAITLFPIDRDRFNNLCQSSPELLASVQSDCLSEVRNLLNRLESFAFRQVRERLAYTLVNEIRRQENLNAKTKELHLTQQELASLVGATRESVSRNLTKLEQEGVLQLGRGRITILDWRQLVKLAGED